MVKKSIQRYILIYMSSTPLKSRLKNAICMCVCVCVRVCVRVCVCVVDGQSVAR
jgi:hypothetical protein